MYNRRKFFSQAARAGLGLACIPSLSIGQSTTFSNVFKPDLFFDISLAEWSLRHWLRSGKISNLEFPETAKNVFGINAVEYVSGFLDDKVTDTTYLKALKQRAKDQDVKNLLIMVDMWGPEGTLASPDKQKRIEAAENHHKWVDAAKYLGCYAIRVNASGYEDADFEAAKDYFTDGLSRLVEYGAKNDISILVENHGGYSSNGEWLAGVMKAVNHKHCGTLPDFGNFTIDRDKGLEYDPLKGLKELMPYAKGVSAKSNNFDQQGNEADKDYPAMLQIVKEAGFKGYIGIEWGGSDNMTPEEGVNATKQLLMKLGKKM